MSLIFVAGLVSAGLGACSSDDPAPASDAGPDTSPRPDVEAPDTALPPGPDAADACDDKGADGLVNSLACTGLYANFDAKTLPPAIKPYVPGTPFWSDGSEKARFLLLPAGQKIDTANMAAWKWPIGTKVWKEFKLAGKRIETRHYTKAASGKWLRASYRWDAAESSATRLDKGERLADGYEIPTLQKCDTCHYGGADQLLGLDAVSLALPSAQGVTLAGLVADGVLTDPPAKTTATLPEDGTGKAAAAIQWLHANCAACHNDSPLAEAAAINLRLALSPSELLGAVPTAVADLSLFKTSYCTTSRFSPGDAAPPLRNVVGGDRAQSAVYVRSNLREPTGIAQMPTIATHKIDTAGVALLGAWIDALPPCP
jgi:hypothetical protein